MSQLQQPKQEPKCEHDKGVNWVASEHDKGVNWVAKNSPFGKSCPFCKPDKLPISEESVVIGSEPSWESIDKKEAEKVDRAILDALPVEPSVEERLRERIKELECRMIDQAVTICEMSKVFAKRISELEKL